MTHILDQAYCPPTRPYSQHELEDRRRNLQRSLRLSEIKAHHSNCHHYYYVRVNGRKEKQITESNHSDSGNCSVCWKLSKTPLDYQNTAHDMADAYMNEFYNRDDARLTHNACELEAVFYTWLYEDSAAQQGNKWNS